MWFGNETVLYFQSFENGAGNVKGWLWTGLAAGAFVSF